MTEDGLFEELRPLVESEDCILLDCRFQPGKGDARVQLVLFRSAGLGTDHCARVHRLVRPRLEILLDTQDIDLEVSSPGLTRVIRLPREYASFSGKGLSVYLKDGRSLGGVIASTDETSLVLRSPRQEYVIAYDAIQKAKLDETQEVN